MPPFQGAWSAPTGKHAMPVGVIKGGKSIAVGAIAIYAVRSSRWPQPAAQAYKKAQKYHLQPSPGPSCMRYWDSNWMQCGYPSLAAGEKIYDIHPGRRCTPKTQTPRLVIRHGFAPNTTQGMGECASCACADSAPTRLLRSLGSSLSSLPTLLSGLSSSGWGGRC